MRCKYYKRTLLIVAASLLLVETVYAWYPSPSYPPYMQPYASGPWTNYGGYGYTPGYYGYVQPRIYLRGHINRYGDYWMDFKIRGISKQDMYKAWIWYNSMREY